jgi:hypothetical protein
MSTKVGLDPSLVKDPTTGEFYKASDVRKVYIS